MDIQNLPKPPLGKSGWPWTEASLPLPQSTPNSSKWPRISVVTPSYNQEQYIEETIRSVLLQNYPNLEYIIIDGGSTDKSIEIIRKYDKYITYQVSEKDRGQSHAINKGFAKSSGDILCWINSDDFLKPGALDFIARGFPDASIPSWLIGSSEIIDSMNFTINIRVPKNITFKNILIWRENWFPQQSTFWSRPMWEAAGNLDEHLYYAMDFSLWINMFKISPPIVVENVLSCYRLQEEAKCVAKPDQAFADILVALSKHIKPTIKDLKFQPILIEALGKVAFDYSYYRIRKSKIATSVKKLIKRQLPIYRKPYFDLFLEI